jgi:hypothetical protein
MTHEVPRFSRIIKKTVERIHNHMCHEPFYTTITCRSYNLTG